MSLLTFLVFVHGIFAIIATIWTYLDSRKHSSYSSFYWMVVVFFLGVPGVALYLMLGRDELSSYKTKGHLENVRPHDSPFDPKN